MEKKDKELSVQEQLGCKPGDLERIALKKQIEDLEVQIKAETELKPMMKVLLQYFKLKEFTKKIVPDYNERNIGELPYHLGFNNYDEGEQISLCESLKEVNSILLNLRTVDWLTIPKFRI